MVYAVGSLDGSGELFPRPLVFTRMLIVLPCKVRVMGCKLQS